MLFPENGDYHLQTVILPTFNNPVLFLVFGEIQEDHSRFLQ